MSDHGAPCWYELSTTDPGAARAFYGPLLGWTFADAGMEGFEYGLASRDGVMVAGLMQPDLPAHDDPLTMPDMAAFWSVYFAVDDCDATAAQTVALGGAVLRAAEDIPGTGRFAVLADPQDAVFCILQPLPGQQGGAFDQQKEGHGNWNELTTPDPAAALAFYSALLGWQASGTVDMPDLGAYRIFGRAGRDIGGILPNRDTPAAWLPYFGVNGLQAAMQQIGDSGGQVLWGPSEVPGGALICVALDPQGARFALVGPA